MILFIHLFLAVLGLRGYVLCSVAQSCLTLCGPWTLALQALLSMEVFLDKNTGGDCHFLLHNFCFFNQKGVCCSFRLGLWRRFRSKFDLKRIPFPLPPSLQKGSSAAGGPSWEADHNLRVGCVLYQNPPPCAHGRSRTRLAATFRATWCFPAMQERITDQLSCAGLCER